MIHNKQNFKTKLELILSWIGAVGITLENQGLQVTDFNSCRRQTPNDDR
jgi:hypothetical protein